MSEFHVIVVKLGDITKHPNADTLSITQVMNGYPCIIRTGDFTPGQLAVYIPVDAVVPTTDPRFAFLADSKGGATARIKAKRLRGVFSMGLLIPAEKGWKEGQIVQDALHITKYEPPLEREGKGPNVKGSQAEKDPGYMVHYDLEGLRRWGRVFQPGDEVVLTEKIHGCQASYLYQDGRLWVKSHNTMRARPHQPTVNERRLFAVRMFFWNFYTMIWATLPWLRSLLPVFSQPSLREVKEDTWWEVARYLSMEETLKEVPCVAIYGEIYGPKIQDLGYGTSLFPRFVMFDAFDTKTRRFYDWDELTALSKQLGISVVPLLYRGPWKEELRQMAEGQTTMNSANHVREGIVIKSAKETSDPHLGRRILKLVGESFYLRK